MSSYGGGGDGKRPSQLKKSFTYHAWQRLRTVCKALEDTEQSVARLKSDIESGLGSHEKVSAKLGEVEWEKAFVGSLGTQLERSRRRVLAAKGRVTKARITRTQADSDRLAFEDEIGVVGDDVQEKRATYIAKREALLRTSSQLGSRRRQLAEELESVYPITSEQIGLANDVGTRRAACDCAIVHRIAGAHVPAAESYAGHNETEIAVGLGYAAHVLSVLCRLLDVSLRFPLRLRGSASAVANATSAGFREAERVVPLFSRGQDPESFGYAVYLLNRDVAQVRGELGLPTPDLRLTLPNLAGLFVHLRAVHIPGGVAPRSALMSGAGSESSELSVPAALPTYSPRAPRSSAEASSSSSGPSSSGVWLKDEPTESLSA